MKGVGREGGRKFGRETKKERGRRENEGGKEKEQKILKIV